MKFVFSGCVTLGFLFPKNALIRWPTVVFVALKLNIQYVSNITFIGAGNVAWHLAQALEDAGHTLVEIYSRNAAHAAALARQLYDVQPVNSLDFTGSRAGIFILAVPDGAGLAVLKDTILPPGATICHTSGTLPLSLLKDFPNRGVFYPLQTFTKNRKLDVSRVPFCIESDRELTEKTLVALAQSLSKTVYLVSSDERKVLHVGAVFACNFTNHLLRVAKDLVEAENLEFDLLKPLIEETFAKVLAAANPADVQTGPAIRGDEQTIQSHLKYLKNFPLQQKIYQLLTESIRRAEE